jgi:hypothetical protein
MDTSRLPSSMFIRLVGVVTASLFTGSCSVVALSTRTSDPACDRSYSIPIVDGVGALVTGAAAVVLRNEPIDSSGNAAACRDDPDQPACRGTTTWTFGEAFFAVSLVLAASAIYGTYKVSKCRATPALAPPSATRAR